MNNLEVDLTKNLGNINTPEEDSLLDNKLVQNYDSEKYKLYLNMIEKYFKEMKSKRYNSKFKYYINDEKNYVKEAIDSENSRDNYIIYTPKYFNLNDKIKEINLEVKLLETNLRYLRESLLSGQKNASSEFDSIRNKLVEKMKEKFILYDVKKYNEKIVNIDVKELEILQELKLNQNTLYNQINNYLVNNDNNKGELPDNPEVNYQFFLKKYVENNLQILEIQRKIRLLKEKQITEYGIEELPDNKEKKPKKKTFKIKKKKAEGISSKLNSSNDLDLTPIKSLENFENDLNLKIKTPEYEFSFDKLNENSDNSINLGSETESDNSINLGSETESDNSINLGSESESDNSINLGSETESDNKFNFNILSDNDNEILSQQNEDNLDNTLANIDLSGKLLNLPEQSDLISDDEDSGLEVSELSLPDINDIVPEYDDYDSDIEESDLSEYVFNKPSSKKEIDEDRNLDEGIPLILDQPENVQIESVQLNNDNINTNSNEMNDEELLNLEKKLKKKVKDSNIKMIHIELNDSEKDILFNKKFKN